MSLAFHKRREAPKPGCHFVAARDLRIGDRTFKAGDPFPHAELGLVHARAVNLWQAGRLKVAPSAPPPKPTARSKPRQQSRR